MDGGPMIDETLWVAIGFVLFVALAWGKASSAIGSLLDARRDEIARKLDEAKSLREEAQAELNKYQKLHREASEQAETIIANAREAAEQIRVNAEQSAEAAIKRKEEQAEAKIRATEAEVVAELRSRAAQLTRQATEKVISAKLDKKGALEMVSENAKQLSSIN